MCRATSVANASSELRREYSRTRTMSSVGILPIHLRRREKVTDYFKADRQEFILHELGRTQKAFEDLLPVPERFPRVWTIPDNLSAPVPSVTKESQTRVTGFPWITFPGWRRQPTALCFFRVHDGRSRCGTHLQSRRRAFGHGERDRSPLPLGLDLPVHL